MREPGSGAPSAGGVPFTDAARRLLTDARNESDRLRHEYVGTEHLVLALARQSNDDSLLARVGLDRDRVRALIEQAVVPGKASADRTMELPYTSRTKKAFSLAADSARAAGQADVGVEHLVVGMLLEGRNIGAEVLYRCGLTAEQAAALVQRQDASGGAA